MFTLNVRAAGMCCLAALGWMALEGPYPTAVDACRVPEASRRKIYGETMTRVPGIPVRSEAR